MKNVLDHKCPKCHAVLKFNPQGQNWMCEYCRSEFNLEQITTSEVKKKNIIENNNNKEEIDLYCCPNCGAEIICDPNVSATSCVYCKNTTILKNKLQGEFNPEYIIPFKHTKEDAENAFKKLGKGKILMPKQFNMKKNIKNMAGIYIPFWLYDYSAEGVVESVCEKISTWKSGNYKYKKIDTYRVTRGGSMFFKNIPVDGSKKFPNDVMNSIEPFDYKDLQVFNHSYLSGFLAEKYDITDQEAIKEGIDRAKVTFIKEMERDMLGYDNISTNKSNINLKNLKSRYVLLPVWMLNIKYKDKTLTFAMNGQTGKIVGNIPIDIKKTIFIWILIFVLIFGLLFLIYYYGVGV